ncbi:MAG TPA: hypothetical protein PKM21_02980 [Anaerolineales bacterium]|nr:hypothetical protein [Anaerolineales bacterium]
MDRIDLRRWELAKQWEISIKDDPAKDIFYWLLDLDFMPIYAETLVSDKSSNFYWIDIPLHEPDFYNVGWSDLEAAIKIIPHGNNCDVVGYSRGQSKLLEAIGVAITEKIRAFEHPRKMTQQDLAHSRAAAYLPGLMGGQTGGPAEREKPWELIPEHYWDRLAVEMWCNGHKAKEIAPKVGVSAEAVTNRLSELRKFYPEAGIPTHEERRRKFMIRDDIR